MRPGLLGPGSFLEPMAFAFLSLQDVLDIHEDQLARYGGLQGFNYFEGVESATTAPQQMWEAEYLHEDVLEMAAAYLFGFAAAQHFTDGNKRTGAATATEFLARNGFILDCPWESL